MNNPIDCEIQFVLVECIWNHVWGSGFKRKGRAVQKYSLHGAARKGDTHAIARYLQDIECDPNERIVYRRCGFFFNYVKILEGVW